jgi:hypothetical protein
MPGKIHVPIAVDVKGIENVTKRLRSLGGTVGKLGLAAAGLAGTFTTAFAVGSIRGARDLERNLAGLETVFKNSTDQMVDFSKNAVDMGLSLNEAAKASTFIGSVLKQSGFSIEETADLTEDLVSLGADLALTYGYDVQEALLGMTALFRGEYDPIEKFGVAMKQSEIDAEKAARGLDGLTGAAERFADQQIRVEFLMERASDALGQVERESQSLTVQQNRMNAAFNNLRDIAAQELIPVMAGLAGATADMLMRITPLVQETFARFEEPLRRIGEWLIPTIEAILVQYMNFLKDLATIMEKATDPTTGLGDALQNARLAVEALFIGFEDFGKGAPSFVEIVTGFVEKLSIAFKDAIFQVQDFFWFVEAFVRALGQIDPLKLIFDPAEQRRFQGYISSFMYQRQSIREQYIKDKEAQEDAAFSADRFARNQQQAYADSLEYLRSIGAINDQIVKQVGDIDDAMDGIDLDLDGVAVSDPVADFFARLEDEIAQQAARVQLETLGLSEALADMIIGSGEGWETLFQTIMDAGAEAAQKLQDKFLLTKQGMEEYEQAVTEVWEELDKLAEVQLEIDQINADLADTIAAIKEEFKEFKEEISDLAAGIDALETYERAIGRFEANTRSDLDQIKSSLKGAFDSEMILEDAFRDLSAYASRELGVLIGIQRQRDDLLAKRDAAAETIFGVAQSVAASANIIGIIEDVQDKTQKIEIEEVMEGIVRSADKLNGFKTTLTRNFTEVVTETIDKSQALTRNFQSVIDKTRLFIDNLEMLREMGLDPFLFNQLVQAGVEAGGATAQALVDGGRDTVDEVNRLQDELNDMGVELGEMTYLVMKEQGQLFVSGIIDGLDDQLADLQNEAVTMANAFAEAFENAFNKAVDAMELKQISVAQEEAAKEVKKIMETVAPPTIDQAAYDKIKGLFEGASRYISNVTDAVKAAGGAAKLSIYQGLLADISAGRPVDVSGIQSGMSTADLAQAALAARSGGTTVVNNVNVSADSPLTAYQAGTNVVNSLLTYQTSSGDYQVTVSGFGA